MLVKSEPLVSIIINNYNYDCFLKEAIDSALNQTYLHTEVIVVDDGSTDRSRDIISRYGNRIIPVIKSNGGQSSSLNEGFKIAKGEVLFFLDSDDLFYPEKIEKIIDLFIQNNLTDSPVVFNNLFAPIDRDGLFIEENMADKLFALQDREWKILSKLNRDFNYISFFDKEMSEICSPDLVYEFARRYRYIPFIGMPTSSIAINRTMAEKLFPLPDSYRISADELIVKAASLIGKVYSTNIVLTKYRLHGNNSWYGKSTSKDAEESAIIQRDNYLNLKLKQLDRKAVFSFFESMQAGGFYRGYFGKHSGNYLLALSLDAIQWHLDSTTISFFIGTFARGVYYKTWIFIHSILKKA